MSCFSAKPPAFLSHDDLIDELRKPFGSLIIAPLALRDFIRFSAASIFSTVADFFFQIG